MKQDKKTSYTAANAIPYKIFKDTKLLESINERGNLRARHVQFLPTNVCNLNCPFCSCSERDKKLEMSWEMCNDIIEKMHIAGMNAVTITGGGEPILFKHFNKMISRFSDFEVKMGLVSNGLALDTISGIVLNKLTWCRISSGDHRVFNNSYYEKLKKVVTTSTNVDWAFSHVVGTNPNFKTISSIIEFANEFKFTHVRLVADLFEVKEIDLTKIKQYLKDQGIDDSLVIYQGRKEHCPGVKKCWISLLKPTIGPDGRVFGCCGAQYAEKEPSRDLSDNLCLGTYKDFLQKLKDNEPFDGSVCSTCYYDNYNDVLDKLLNVDINHMEFI